MDAGQRAVALNPYDMGARGVLGMCHLVIGEHRTGDRAVLDGRAATTTAIPDINGRR